MEIKNRIIKQELAEWRKFTLIQNYEFKNLSKDAETKLIESMIANNFIMSFHCWQDGEKIYCIDGHQRIQKIFPKLESMGYKLPERFPTNFINCADLQEAAQLVFVFNSRYAEIDKDEAKDLIINLNLDAYKIEKETYQLGINVDEFLRKQEYEEVEIKEEKLIPFKKTHILLSFNPEKLIELKLLLEEIKNLGYVEYEQSSN